MFEWLQYCAGKDLGTLGQNEYFIGLVIQGIPVIIESNETIQKMNYWNINNYYVTNCFGRRCLSGENINCEISSGRRFLRRICSHY